ncbi:MAG: hypothetical protein CMM56_03250 [Rhodospirillaceae bacterium]|nr:hypothetical protein [Rhodospirillaceae bacterium]
MNLKLSSKQYEVETEEEAQEYFHAKGLTDGLPIIPPTEERVSACLHEAGMVPSHVIGAEPVRGRLITAEKTAINAVLAGCQPVHFPIVVAAIEAMCRSEFLLHGAMCSTGGCAVFMVVNGPIRKDLNMNSTFNVLGNSDRASAVIGRSIRLVLNNILDIRSGGLDRSTLGHPGKFSYCVAEDEEGSGWIPLAQQLGGTPDLSTVTVLAAGSPRQIMNEWTSDPEEILETFAAEIRANMLHYSVWGGNYVIIIPKQLRDRIENAQWSKSDVQQFIYKKARVKKYHWRQVGKNSLVKDDQEEEYCALTKLEDLLVIAAGGPAGGFGAVIPPWFGHKSRAITAGIGICFDC